MDAGDEFYDDDVTSGFLDEALVAPRKTICKVCGASRPGIDLGRICPPCKMDMRQFDASLRPSDARLARAVGR